MANPPKMPDGSQAEIDFLRTELHTGLTMAKIASSAEHQDKFDRNRINSRKAYDTVLHFLKKTALTESEAEEIRDMLKQLKSALVDLGEEL
jgi:predicted transcriptional regulator